MSKKSQAKVESEVVVAGDIWAADKAPQYKLLNKVNEYDHELVEELAVAMNELKQHEQRVAGLRDLIAEHQKYTKFIWTTLESQAIPLHKLTDDHLTNILGHIAARGVTIPKEIRAEAVSRNLPIPIIRPGHYGVEVNVDWDDAIRARYGTTEPIRGDF